MNPLYTVKEAALILRVNEATIYRAIKAGTINYRCAGKKSYRFTEEDLLTFATPTKAQNPKPEERKTPVLRIT